MGWKPFCIGLLIGLLGATLAVGLYSCGGPASTPTVAATATPPPALTVQRVIQGFRDAGLRVETTTDPLTYRCITDGPGLIEYQTFGTNRATVSLNVVASFANPRQAEDARAACTVGILSGYRREAIILVVSGSTPYQPYFTVLQALR
jgi:hypothetical protein